MGLRMGYWDCQACGAKRIQGPERQCASCGQPRAKDVQFYTDPTAPEVEDAALIARARAGADWHCPYCGADNPAGATSCVSCGASTEGAAHRQERLIPAAPPPSKAPPKKAGLGVAIGLLVLIAIGVAAWALFLRTSAVPVTLVSKEWEKTLVVERLETEKREAWSGDVPASARRISSSSRMRKVEVEEGTTKVKVGQRDLGNGFFEDIYEERPKRVEREVQATWVVYEVDRWRASSTKKEVRADGTEPPEPKLERADPRLREGRRESRFLLGLKGPKDERYAFEIDADGPGRARAARLEVGQRVTAEINALGSVRDLY